MREACNVKRTTLGEIAAFCVLGLGKDNVLTKFWHDRRVRWAAPIAWMGLIFYLSSRADYPSLLPSGWGDAQSILAHLAIYAVLALLWERALRTAGIRRPLLWAFAIATLYGVSDEFHQRFVPGRSGNGFDVATDAVAAALALSIATWARRRVKPKGLGTTKK